MAVSVDSLEPRFLEIRSDVVEDSLGDIEELGPYVGVHDAGASYFVDEASRRLVGHANKPMLRLTEPTGYVDASD